MNGSHYWIKHPIATDWADRYIKTSIEANLQLVIAEAASRIATMLTPETYDTEATRQAAAMAIAQDIARTTLYELEASVEQTTIKQKEQQWL